MDRNKKRTTRRKITVPPQMSMWRLDRVLSHALDSWSRKYIGELVSAKAVWVGGKLAMKGTKKVRGGDEIEINRKKYQKIDGERKKRDDIASFAYTGKVSAVVPEEIPLDIVYEDAQLLVVDKPAGMVIHPAYANTSGTLANAVAWYFRKSGIPVVRRIGLVHRLDKDVSGLVMIAKNDHAMEELSRQFSSEGIQHGYIDLSTKAWKYYRAEVEEREDGMLRAADFAVGEKKLVEGWVRRSKTDRRKYEFITYRPEMSEEVQGKYAASYMTLISHRNTRIELQVQIVTGRTHQIRVQLSSIGLPIVGDCMYGSGGGYMKLRCEKISYIPPSSAKKRSSFTLEGIQRKSKTHSDEKRVTVQRHVDWEEVAGRAVGPRTHSEINQILQRHSLKRGC